MNLHEMKSTPGSRSSRKRVGRGAGSGLGKTSGRGHKGQYARSGHKHKPGFEGGQMRLVRRLPKRGFTNSRTRRLEPVNVGDLEARFEAGAEITMTQLLSAGLLRSSPHGIKILGAGELSKKLIVKANAFSASARTKIEAAGGACEVVGRLATPPAAS